MEKNDALPKKEEERERQRERERESTINEDEDNCRFKCMVICFPEVS